MDAGLFKKNKDFYFSINQKWSGEEPFNILASLITGNKTNITCQLYVDDKYDLNELFPFTLTWSSLSVNG